MSNDKFSVPIHFKKIVTRNCLFLESKKLFGLNFIIYSSKAGLFSKKSKIYLSSDDKLTPFFRASNIKANFSLALHLNWSFYE